MATKKINYDRIIARRQELKEQEKVIAQELKGIEEQLSELKYGKHEFKSYVVNRTPIMKLDAAIFEEEFPADERPELYKLALDTDEIKKHFSPKQLDAYKSLSYVRNYITEKE